MYVLYSPRIKLYLTEEAVMHTGITTRLSRARRFTTKAKALAFRDGALREDRSRKLFVPLPVDVKRTASNQETESHEQSQSEGEVFPPQKQNKRHSK